MKKAHEPGVCPECGNDGLEYKSSALEGESMGYDWKCLKCGTTGVEWYDLVFSNHKITLKRG